MVPFPALLSIALALGLEAAAAEPPRVEPSRPRGVFCRDEPVSFRIEAPGDFGRPRIIDVDGKEASPPSIEKAGEGKHRLDLPGIGPGWYRLEIPPAGDRPGATVPFAVLAQKAQDAESLRGPPASPLQPIACDGAISWLVARPDAPDCLRLARLAGLRLLRDRIAWGEVEPRPGEFSWGRYDRVATESKEAGLAVYQIFHSSPAWARADHEAKRLPEDLRSVWRFARAAGKQFEGRVVAWEPWNEPDIEVFCKDPADQVAAHQKAAYLGFKAASPSLGVTMVSLAMPPGPFIEIFLENETGPYFEIYNFHTYDPLDGYPRRARAHLDVMERFGLGDKTVWVTEAGIGLKAQGGNLTQADALRQAEFLPKAYVLSIAGGTPSPTWLHFFFIIPWYLENGVQFGLLEKDLRPGPGYVALAALTNALGEARRPRPLTALPGGATGWLFERSASPAEETAVLWAGKEASLAVPEGLEALDHFGRRIELGAGRQATIGPRPVYLIGKPEICAALKPGPEAGRKIATRPPEFTLPAIVLRFVFPADRSAKSKEAWKAKDGVLAGKLQVYNFGTAPFRGTVKLSGDPGLAIEPGEKAIEVAPEGLETFEVKVTRGKEGAEVRKVRAVAVPEGASGPAVRSSAAVARVIEG